jgi:hypothetical protein
VCAIGKAFLCGGYFINFDVVSVGPVTIHSAVGATISNKRNAKIVECDWGAENINGKEFKNTAL